MERCARAHVTRAQQRAHERTKCDGAKKAGTSIRTIAPTAPSIYTSEAARDVHRNGGCHACAAAMVMDGSRNAGRSRTGRLRLRTDGQSNAVRAGAYLVHRHPPLRRAAALQHSDDV